MADYLTQPSSTESAVSKVRKIRSELQKQKEKVSKKREKFAKRTLGLQAGMAIGNAALKGALNRYQLRNQPELNLLKGLEAQAIRDITVDENAMKTWGTAENYIFNDVKDRYKEEVGLRAGEGYIYSSDHWSDELKADVAEKTKAYNERLIAARRIAEGNVDKAFAGLKEQELPSNLWSWFSRSAKRAVRGHDATTIKLKADQSFNKLIDNDIFAAHKDFQTKARVYNALNPGGLQKVLSEIDKNKQKKWAKVSLQSEVMEAPEVKVINGKKVQVKTNKLVITAIKEQAGTGELVSEQVLEKDFEGGTIPVEIITATQINAYNDALSVEGKAKLAQLLEQEAYMLDPSKAYLEVIRLGNEVGREDKSMINPYLAPDIDLNLIREKLTLAIGNDISALLRIPRIEDFDHIANAERRQEAFERQIDDYNLVKAQYAQTVADAVNLVADSMIQANVIPSDLPKP